MFDPKWIREHPDLLDRGLKRRGLAPASKRLIALDEKRREAIAKAQGLQERRNAVSKEIGEAKKAKDEARAQKLMAEIAAIKESVPKCEEEQGAAEKAFDTALAEIPNVPFDDVPDGTDANANVERHRVGKTPKFDFKPKLHFEIGEALGLMDFEAAAKLSGARFVVLKGALARLERALAQFMLDVHTGEHGYTEVATPLLVRDAVMFGTGQLPKFAEDQFQVPMVSFEQLFEKMLSRLPENVSAVQAKHESLFGREMTVEEAISSLLEAIKLGMPEYRELYEAETGRPSRLWLIPTAEVPLTNLTR